MCSGKKIFSIFFLCISSLCGATGKFKNNEDWQNVFTMSKDSELIFTTIFNKNLWFNEESVSGAGSNLKATHLIRKSLPKLIKKYSITSLLDIPCGDFYWFNTIDIGACTYRGMDIVKELIDKNNNLYANEVRTFQRGDALTDTLPTVDLILCRDMLVHFDFESIFKALKNFKRSGSRYLLVTVFPNVEENKNIKMGTWRMLNFQKAPFNFPAHSAYCPIDQVGKAKVLRSI